MAMLTTRINIQGKCQTKGLWTGKISAGDTLGIGGDALDGVKPSTWRERGSDTEERSLLVDEGSSERNIPLHTFNILQAAESEPREVMAIIHSEAPRAEDKFDLQGIEMGTKKWYKELVEVLVYLSVDKHEDYGERYWYQPWQKAKERNPELLGEGRRVLHPGKDAEPEETEEEPSDRVQSAAEANW